MYSNDVDKQRILRFTHNRVLYGIQTGTNSIGGVDSSAGYIIQAARNNGSLKLDNLEMMRIIGNILNAGGDILLILNLDQALSSKHEQCTATIGRIVRNSDFCTIRNGVARLQLFGINVNREQSGVEGLSQLEGRLLLHRCLQERFMLEAVGPDFTSSQSRVRSYKIAELLNLNFQALLLCNLLHVVHDNCMGTRIYTNDNRLIHVNLFVVLSIAAATGSHESEHCQHAHQSVF